MNVFIVQTVQPVAMGPSGPHFSGKETTHLYVLASGFSQAEAAVRKKHPGVAVRSINLMNYASVPIIMGE